MAETTGIARFPGNLDPRAEEFRPRNPSTTANQLVLFPSPPPPPPPQVYYPYATPYPPISEVQVMPFCDGAVGYPGQQFPSPPQPVALRVGIAAPPPPPPALASPASSAAATRAVVLSSVPREASETTVRRELEVFGEVRGVQMERLTSDGIVTVHFYDLRHAETAIREIRDQHMHHQTRLRNHYASTATTYSLLMMRNSPAGPTVDDIVHNWAAASFLPPPPAPPPALGLISGRPVWAQFVIPPSNAVPDGHNQGTIVIFNLDPEVTASTLKDIFQEFGPIKELRETPSKKQQKFVEFFDVRDAAKALKEMNGKEIHGKTVVIEFSRPGGHHSRKLVNAAAATTPTSHHHKYLAPPLPAPLQRKFSVRSAFNNNFSNIPPRAYASHPQFPVRKSNGNKIVSSSTTSSSSLSSAERKMASVSFCNGNEERTKRFSRKNQSSTQASPAASPSSPPPTQQQTLARSIKSRKGKHVKKFDSRFLISEEAMTESSCKDTRTTVMIKNIPNKYSQKLLLNMLDNHCINCNQQIADGGEDDDQPFSSYDFVYLPIDFNNKCNVGYGFVNMTSPEATWRLYKAFHLQLWEAFNSRKICEVTYARVQGLEALKEHFKNSKFPCEMDHYLPVVFSPPRDGRQLTEPLPIVGQNKHLGGPGPPLVPSPMSTPTLDHDDDQVLDGGDVVETDTCHGSPDHEPGSGSPNGGVVSGDDNDEEEEEDDGEDDGDHDQNRQIYIVC